MIVKTTPTEVKDSNPHQSAGLKQSWQFRSPSASLTDIQRSEPPRGQDEGGTAPSRGTRHCFARAKHRHSSLRAARTEGAATAAAPGPPG